ncbi:RidA family protein [Parvibium lacunae]|uniref:RidA family protein n=1 Tax=Parvibium lacunae TaxID=1888893 RepID=A0A368L3D4_9BURK|nr:Rid family hydrolase [Parvibium lacunae]RCS58089.1 RidA family protein [Parvibium lacunae]
MFEIQTHNPAHTPTPIGPYHHIAQAGPFIWLSGTPGVDPATGQLAGTDAGSQTTQIMANLHTMLASCGASLAHLVHVTVFLKKNEDFAAMNVAYEQALKKQAGGHLPARTVIVVADLPKPGALLTMNAQAIRPTA